MKLFFHILILSQFAVLTYSRDFVEYIKREKWEYINYTDHAGVRYLPCVDENGKQAIENQNTIWNSVGYAKYRDNNGKLHEFIYLGVSNHANRIAIYEYSINEDKMRCLGLVNELLHLSDWNWQAKIHTYFVQNPNDGKVYFGTDCGEHKTGLRDHPAGYHGGFWACLDPKTKQVTNLGHAHHFRSVKVMALDPVFNRLYGCSYDVSHWMVYDIKTGVTKDYGIYNGWHSPRFPFCDKWGNGYTSDTYGFLVKFIASENKLIHTETRLPSSPNTDISSLAHGIHSVAYNSDSSQIYCNATYNRIFILFPENGRSGGKIEDLGHTWMDRPEYYYKQWDKQFYERKGGSKSICYHPSGKIYYGTGSEIGHVLNHIDSLSGREYLMEYDLKTRKKRIVHHFNERVITCCDGCNMVDSKGCIYFGAMGQSIFSENYIMNGPRKPYLVIIDLSKLKPEEYINEGKFDKKGNIIAHPVVSPWVK
ncbi:MAG: hypothetical protein AB1633_09960 [Elusimicrobiota bacterium]